MRADFVRGLCSLAERDPRIVFLTADLGFGVVEPFAQQFPDRFLNVGVAEQAMIGAATGLAEAGFIPYCYSIASFAVARTFEFIRNGPIAHCLPVRIVGVGPGTDYSHDGFTHFAVEDLAMLMPQPRVTIVSPATLESARSLGACAWPNDSVIYFRIPRSGLAELQPDVDSRDWLVCAGDAYSKALALQVELRSRHSVETRVVVQEVLNREALASLAHSVATAAKSVVVVENHYARGGLTSWLAQDLMELGWRGQFQGYAIEGDLFSLAGSPEHLASATSRPLNEVAARIVGNSAGK